MTSSDPVVGWINRSNDNDNSCLIAGGHTLGKTHGAASGDHLGASPEGAGIEEQGFGWKSNYGTGKGKDAITSGLEVIWTPTPTKWSHAFLSTLFNNEWELTKSPAGAHQWVPKRMLPRCFQMLLTLRKGINRLC